MTFLNNKLKTEKRRAGFTLTELLVLVGIILVLATVVLLAVTTIRKQLRQRELDSKAEIIYVAAQNRIAELRASGYESTYQPDTSGSNVTKLGYRPVDAEETLEIDALYYVSSADRDTEDTAAAALLPVSSVDEELRGHNWRIEFDPVSGSVYGVFYSETVELPAAKEADDYRLRKTRLAEGARVGYYGGDVTDVEAAYKLEPEIQITNEEKLTAVFYCTSPTANGDLRFTITLSDGTNTYKEVIDKPTKVNNRTYRYTWVLDSLESAKARFYAQTKGQLSCGISLTVELSVHSTNPRVDDASVSAVTNSLFADVSDSTTAVIAYGRHLQNLDQDSHVSESITSAVQISNISFTDDEANDKDWYSYYNAKYCYDAGFHPIRNKKLTSYDGCGGTYGTNLDSTIFGLNIRKPDDGTDLGLFESFAGTIQNIDLSGTKIGAAGDTATSVGSLVGCVTGNLTLRNCHVYLNAQKGDLTGLSESTEPGEVAPWLQGGVVGGLIGTVEGGSVAIEESFAASALHASSNAGGLIGQAKGDVSVSTSYADCYLKGATTGGLIGGVAGNASVSLANFYAAGYQTATVTAAGLVAGALKIAQNGYAAFDYTTAEGLQIYTTATAGGDISGVYYLTGFGEAAVNLETKTEGKTYKELSDDSTDGVLTLLGDAFTLDSGDASFPYNLLQQGLTYYNYPRLTKLEHYSDWPAEFESGSLVYYEVYKNEDGSYSYGFSGGNVDTLRSDKIAVGDGYAVAFDREPDTSIQITAGQTTKVIKGNQDIPAVDSKTGKTYYLVKLPDEFVNPKDNDVGSSFYQQIQVGDTRYYFNPYFAKTVTVNTTTPKAPETIHIRTARQLYALSRLYPKYAAETKESLFQQELDIDYSQYVWSDYAGSAAVSSQEPITSTSGFVAEYDGGCHTIRGVSFRSTSSNIGMFGLVAANAEVQNVFLLAPENGVIAYGSDAASGSRSSVNMGALAGYNQGYIRNCVVNGYSMTYHGYYYNTLNLGGLVGVNAGDIRSCEANTPSVEISAYNAYAYAGGFAGRNQGTITTSYALGQITVKYAQNATVWIAGFAANNTNGVARRCYSATALTASGNAESYGFAHNGGTVTRCYYLDGGTYDYAEELYAYNSSKNDFVSYASGTARTGNELQDAVINGFSQAVSSYDHDKTADDDGNGYPYPAVVSDANGQTVHYGDWPIQKDIGTLGVFYWEYEQGGSNSGYHFSYVGTSQGTVISTETDEAESTTHKALGGESLCREHDDGGVITEYGYGYFYQTQAEVGTGQTAVKPTLTEKNCVMPAEKNEDASNALGQQMPGYTFVAYNTASVDGKDGIYLNTADENATWELQYDDSYTYTYTISPFFADAISLDEVSLDGVQVSEDAGLQTTKTGTADKPYEIRSVRQLQFINWNYGYLTAKESIAAGNYTNAKRKQYTYLVYSAQGAVASSVENLYWQQSHDVNAATELGESYNFQPIGCLYETASNGDTSESHPYLVLFTSSFDGQSYVIRNIAISSTTQSIGLFGMTAAAELKNIVMYSDNGSKIIHEEESVSWYTMGGLVGFAAKGSTALANSVSGDERSNTISNCTVSGYEIIDRQQNQPGWGGGNVGGLIGSTNMTISECTAENDITLSIGGTYITTHHKNLRVGGLVGVARSTIRNCYAGGSIKSTVEVDYAYTDTKADSGASIWVSGIAGGIVLRCTGTLGSLIGGVDTQLVVENCYSYVDLPSSGGNDLVAASQSIASNGELQSTAFTLAADGLTTTDVIIKNCYCLDSRVKNTDDYKKYENCYETTDGIDLNYRVNRQNSTTYDGRSIYLQNGSQKPYLTYTEMSDGTLKNLLGTAFSTVTTREFGASIDGKYSFPGTDESLNGLNYPFPTVLTQTDPFGNTVNVHYGAWPKEGLKWQNSTAGLDLLADLDETGTPALDWKLYDSTLSGSAVGSDVVFKIEKEAADPDAETSGETDVPLQVTSCTYETGEGFYTVHFTAAEGTEPGVYVVTAESGSSAAVLHLTVTAELTIEVTPQLQLHVSEKTEQVIRLIDKNGEAFETPQGKRLNWSIVVENVGVDEGVDPVSWDAIEKKESAAGEYILPISGFAEGEATIRIRCTYADEGADPEGTGLIVGETVIATTTVADDVLGLTNGEVAQEISVPYTPDSNDQSGIEAGAPFGDLSLYVRGGHGETCLTPASFAITAEVDGSTAEVVRDNANTEETGASSAQVTIGRELKLGETSYCSVKVDHVGTWNALTLYLTRSGDDATYTLVIQNPAAADPEEQRTDDALQSDEFAKNAEDNSDDTEYTDADGALDEYGISNGNGSFSNENLEYGGDESVDGYVADGEQKEQEEAQTE